MDYRRVGKGAKMKNILVSLFLVLLVDKANAVNPGESGLVVKCGDSYEVFELFEARTQLGLSFEGVFEQQVDSREKFEKFISSYEFWNSLGYVKGRKFEPADEYNLLPPKVVYSEINRQIVPLQIPENCRLIRVAVKGNYLDFETFERLDNVSKYLFKVFFIETYEHDNQRGARISFSKILSDAKKGLQLASEIMDYFRIEKIALETSYYKIKFNEIRRIIAQENKVTVFAKVDGVYADFEMPRPKRELEITFVQNGGVSLFHDNERVFIEGRRYEEFYFYSPLHNFSFKCDKYWDSCASFYSSVLDGYVLNRKFLTRGMP